MWVGCALSHYTQRGVTALVLCPLSPAASQGYWDLREGQVIPLIWGKTSPGSDVLQHPEVTQGLVNAGFGMPP